MNQEPRPLIAGNWKMFGNLASAKALIKAIAAEAVSGVDWMVCPPAIYIQAVKGLAGKQIEVAGQNLAEFANGAYTGEISAEMLVDQGCKYVLTGHSERRTCFGESNDVVARKVKRAVEAGIIPIICLGETEQERLAGRTEDVIRAQLEAICKEQSIRENMVLAYEPVWAIGTGKTATAEEAQTVHGFIRQQVSVFSDEGVSKKIRILYGGSVKPENAKALFAQADIDGGLIGGAALDADSFLSIGRAALASE